jgi:CheY-like chemotaxis protein
MARVLIVDDEPDIRLMMKLIFELAGHEVFDARHGGAALECRL